jgi:hypothetical protein
LDKIVALLLVLAFLTASCIAVKPAMSSVDVAENSWVSKEPMQVARTGLGVVAVNGKIYAIGGSTASGSLPSVGGGAVLGYKDLGGHVGINEEYDTETDTWITKASMPTPRIVFATAVCQNKIYCIGGKTSNGFTGVNEAYDPATDTWETKKPMPTARGWLTAGVVKGKIYLIGGSPNGTLNEVYDSATDSWTSKASIPFAAWAPVSTVVDDKIYVIGSSKLQIYDPENDGWSQGASPLVGGGYGAGVTTGVFAPKRIHVIPNAVYDPDTDSWMATADLSTKRYSYDVAVVNDMLYAIGGHTYDPVGSFAAVNVNEQYTPFGYETPDPSYVTPSPSPTPSQDFPTPEPEPEPFPSTLVIAFVITAAVYGIGLLVYFKKRKQ